MAPLDANKEMLAIENKFAAISIVAKHARRVREHTNMDKAEKHALGEYLRGQVAIDDETLPAFLKEPEEAPAEAGRKKRKTRRR